ncbi:uncharacterized protein LOC141913987 [Tubulanus polymorphus]|uniref:uncharacterized protein LOC141913987 n=1 Tax=Tubulanus polymorphus TaxID=672921 RepID=UPI003DA3733D
MSLTTILTATLITVYSVTGIADGLAWKCYQCEYGTYDPLTVESDLFLKEVSSMKRRNYNLGVRSIHYCYEDPDRLYGSRSSTEDFTSYRCGNGGDTTYCMKETITLRDGTFFMTRKCSPDCVEETIKGPTYTKEIKCCSSGSYCNSSFTHKGSLIAVLFALILSACTSPVFS